MSYPERTHLPELEPEQDVVSEGHLPSVLPRADQGYVPGQLRVLERIHAMVQNVNRFRSPEQRLDVLLHGPTALSFPDGGETLPVDVETTITWTGHPDAQFHVQATANYGAMTTVSDGFESGEFDPAYTTGGDADWFVNTQMPHSGAYSARAGVIGSNDQSWLTRTVTSPPRGENFIALSTRFARHRCTASGSRSTGKSPSPISRVSLISRFSASGR